MLAVATPYPMKRLLLIALLVTPTVAASPALAWWGLTDQMKAECRNRAARELNEFSARLTYQECTKTIKSVFKEREKRRLEAQNRRQIREAEKASLMTDLMERCKLYQAEAIELQAERNKYYDNYRSSSESFWDYVRANGYYKQGSTSSDYPDHVRERFPWVKWYGDYYAREKEFEKRFQAGIPEYKNVKPYYLGTWDISRCNFSVLEKSS